MFWALLLQIHLIQLFTSFSMAVTYEAFVFKQFLPTGKTAKGTSVEYSGVTPSTCGRLCEEINCLVIAYDRVTVKCKVYSELDRTLTTVTEASPTYATYVLQNYDDENDIVFLEARASWQENVDLCAENGGILAAPKHSQMAVAFYITTKVERLVIGMKKNPDTGVWEDLHGDPVEDIDWDTGEPDSQTMGFLKNGRYWDINNRNDMNYSFAVCALPRP